MSRILRPVPALLAALLLIASAARAGDVRAFGDLARTKADVTIVVTDSGLGGLSVAADLAARLPASGIVKSARIVFVNASPMRNGASTTSGTTPTRSASSTAHFPRWRPGTGRT